MTDYKLIIATNGDGALEIRYRKTNDTHWQTVEVESSLQLDDVIQGVVNVLQPNPITRKLAGAL